VYNSWQNCNMAKSTRAKKTVSENSLYNYEQSRSILVVKHESYTWSHFLVLKLVSKGCNGWSSLRVVHCAGIFIIYRFNNFITNSTTVRTILLISSLLTILITRIRAIAEKDIKKIIALSTLRQLRLITLCRRLKIFNLIYFHIVTHAIFKALLFICAGSIISINSHNQDTRLYGKYIFILPQISFPFLISRIAIIGVPFIVLIYMCFGFYILIWLCCCLHLAV